MKNPVNIKQAFRPKIALRLLAICVLGCTTGWLWFASPYWMAGLWTGLATVGLFYETVRFMDQSERKLTAFLQALRQSDFSVTFSENKRTTDYDLHQAFNQLNDTFRKLRSEKESQHRLLQAIVEHATTPLVCYEEDNGEVYLINDAAKILFRVSFLKKIDALWKTQAGLPEFLVALEDGKKDSFKLTHGGRTLFLSAVSRHILFRNKNLKLIALHDVSSELAVKEAETWQKLLRVLTHEISNSAIPLSTLSAYINETITQAEADGRTLTGEERTDMLDSLRTIAQRSRSLKEFVQNFKSVNQIPEPVFARIRVKDIVDEVVHLFGPEFVQQEITLQTHITDTYTIYADQSLTMQVVLNLIKNAMEAMSNYKTGKRITIEVNKEGDHYVSVHVTDTGCGIAMEDLEQIFIPFYSTKKGGSGIGLSISQQIMQKQKGNIAVRSVPGKGSVFTLTFPG